VLPRLLSETAPTFCVSLTYFFEFDGVPDGKYLIGDIRVAASFPETLGASHEGGVEYGPFLGENGSIFVSDCESSGSNCVTVTPAIGEPPLRLQGAEFVLRASEEPDAPNLIRCDVDADGSLQITDSIATPAILFRGAPMSRCREVVDCDDDVLDLSDASWAFSSCSPAGTDRPIRFLSAVESRAFRSRTAPRDRLLARDVYGGRLSCRFLMSSLRPSATLTARSAVVLADVILL